MKKIIVASDQVAYHLKQAVITMLRGRGIEAADGGTHSPDIIVDYPDVVRAAMRRVSSGEFDGGVVICGTGLGASIAANKCPGIRAALCTDTYTAHQARAHNDANALALGAWVTTEQRAEGILDEWLQTPFEGGRHTARLSKLDVDFAPLTEKTDFSACPFYFSVAISLQPTAFAPVLYSGRVEEGMRKAAEAGFSHVELSIRQPETVDLRTLRGWLEDYGLRVSALATGQGCIHDGLCLAAADDKLREKAVERMLRITDIAAALDAPVIIGGVRGRLDETAGHALQYDRTLEAVMSCVAYARALGVDTLLEMINRYETNLYNTVAEGLDVIRTVEQPNFKLLVDMFHANIEEVDIPRSLRTAGDRLGYIHLVDSNRQAAGQGHISFQPIFETLQAMGYAGCLSAEILPLPDDASAVQRTADYLGNLLGAPLEHFSARVRAKGNAR